MTNRCNKYQIHTKIWNNWRLYKLVTAVYPTPRSQYIDFYKDITFYTPFRYNIVLAASCQENIYNAFHIKRMVYEPL